MKVPKFIICKKQGLVGTFLRLGLVEFHKDLIFNKNTETCLGGGMFEIDNSGKTLYLFDKSYDFGYPQFKNLKYVSDDFDGFDIKYYPSDREDAVSVNRLTEETIEYTDEL